MVRIGLPPARHRRRASRRCPSRRGTASGLPLRAPAPRRPRARSRDPFGKSAGPASGASARAALRGQAIRCHHRPASRVAAAGRRKATPSSTKRRAKAQMRGRSSTKAPARPRRNELHRGRSLGKGMAAGNFLASVMSRPVASKPRGSASPASTIGPATAKNPVSSIPQRGEDAPPQHVGERGVTPCVR